MVVTPPILRLAISWGETWWRWGGGLLPQTLRISFTRTNIIHKAVTVTVNPPPPMTILLWLIYIRLHSFMVDFTWLRLVYMVSFVCLLSRYIYLSSHIWILCEWPFPVCPFSKKRPRLFLSPRNALIGARPELDFGETYLNRGGRVGVDLAGVFGCLHGKEPLILIVVWFCLLFDFF